MAAPTDPATRIITHMNDDHQDSLMRYLEHYHNVPSHTARHAHLMNITLSEMRISVSPSTKTSKGTLSPNNLPSSTTYTIPFDPPMASFTEARDRVVQMDKESLAALGREPITLKHYVSPLQKGGVDLIVTTLVVMTVVLLHRRSWLVSESAPAFLKSVWDRFPTFSKFLYDIQPNVLGGMLVIHAGEAWFMDYSRLRKYSVPRGSAIWYKWMLGTFVGGFTNFQKVDEWAKKEMKEREKKKH